MRYKIFGFTDSYYPKNAFKDFIEDKLVDANTKEEILSTYKYQLDSIVSHYNESRPEDAKYTFEELINTAFNENEKLITK